MRSDLRRRILCIAVLSTVTSAALLAIACNQVSGLDDFRPIDCYESPCVDAGLPDVTPAEAAADARPDGFVEDAGPIADGGVFEHRTWAHWKMPNPDAGGVPGLPNQMKYDAGNDGTFEVITDYVTGLQWQAKVRSSALPVSKFEEALNECSKGGGWRVPTRIELVTLIDFTRTNPALHSVFQSPTADKYGGGGAFKRFWSASTVAGQKTTYWSVNFETAKVEPANGDTVRCVRGGPAR